MKRAILWELVLIALQSIRGNLLRTGLTVSIIGLGIMALISMTTATSSLEANIVKQLSSLGTNSFTIRQATEGGFMSGRRVQIAEPIGYREAQALARESEGQRWILSYSLFGSAQATLSRADKRSDPNIRILGVDPNYLEVSGFEIAEGRNITPADVTANRDVVVIGPEILNDLFDPWEEPLGATLLISGQRYTVIGILKARGQAFGMNQDQQCMVSVPSARRQFSDEGRSYTLVCKVRRPEDLESAMATATGLFRTIRRDAPGAPNSFRVEQSTQLVATLRQATQGITIAATVIGLITLFGAGIGLMNIMLVSVSERTREIGVRKSLGATPAAIRTQFLVEVMVIGQIGGLLGILSGLVVGNIVASYLETPFVVPWLWISVGVIMSLVTSILSGYYPARQAARLDPIVALGRE